MISEASVFMVRGAQPFRSWRPQSVAEAVDVTADQEAKHPRSSWLEKERTAKDTPAASIRCLYGFHFSSLHSFLMNT